MPSAAISRTCNSINPHKTDHSQPWITSLDRGMSKHSSHTFTRSISGVLHNSYHNLSNPWAVCTDILHKQGNNTLTDISAVVIFRSVRTFVNSQAKLFASFRFELSVCHTLLQCEVWQLRTNELVRVQDLEINPVSIHLHACSKYTSLWRRTNFALYRIVYNSLRDRCVRVAKFGINLFSITCTDEGNQVFVVRMQSPDNSMNY